MSNCKRTYSLIFLVALCPVGLGGCAGTAGSARYDALTTKYSRDLGTERSAKSNERKAWAAPVLNRVDFVQEVLRENPNIETARQSLRASLARVRGAGAFDDPMVDLGLAPLSIGSSKARLGYQVGISQRLPWFGKRSLETQSVAAEAAAASSDFEATRQQLALSAVVLYEQYFVAVRSIAIDQHHAALMESFHRGAMAQFEAGRGSAQDPLQAETELAELERQTVVHTAERDITVAQMNELLHREPNAALPPPPQELALPIDFDAKQAALYQSEAAHGRPEIAAAKQRAEAEQARVDRAGRDAYPDVTLSTSYSSMWDMPEHRWMVGLSFNLPVQTGAREGAKEEATAMRAQFESEARSLENSSRREVFVAVRELQKSRAVLDVYEQRLLPIAKSQVDAASAGFVSSRNPFTAVIDAEKNLRDAELDYQMARAEYVTRRGELDRALGRVPGLDWKEEAR